MFHLNSFSFPSNNNRHSSLRVLEPDGAGVLLHLVGVVELLVGGGPAHARVVHAPAELPRQHLRQVVSLGAGGEQLTVPKHNKYFSARANIFYLSNPHIPDAVELATVVADLLPARRVPLQQSENNLGRCHVRLTMTIKIYFSINYSLISFIFPASVSFREQMRTVREL